MNQTSQANHPNKFQANLARGFGWGAGLIIIILYSPVFAAYFNADDFSFLRFLHFNRAAMLNGLQWEEWFIGGIVNYSVFRPMSHVYWLLNFIAFGLEPFGYHAVSVLSHWIVSLLVFILIYLLTRQRVTAGIGALIFASMPVHAEAVSWLAANYDVWCGIYFLLAISFFILYRRKLAWRFYLIALIAFALALSSRETALTFPAIVFAYDAIYWRQHRTDLRRIVIEHIPFWVVAAGRLIFFGHGYRGLTLAPEGWAYYVDANLARVFDPLAESLGDLRWVALGCVACLLLAYRWRAEIIFGLLWIPITLFTTTVGGVNDRSFYIPSFGVALVGAIVLASFVQHKTWVARIAGLAGVGAVILLYSNSLWARNQAYVRASQVTQAILQRVTESHPTMPPEARLVFAGVPDATTEGAPVFGAGFWEALTIVYDDPSLQISKSSRFPIWLDDLDRTFFFQVDHRRVAERADLIATLASRKQCADFSRPALTWDFSRDSQGWVAWNDLDELANRDGALITRATGDDPYMGSPVFDIPSLALGDIEITLRVRAAQPTFAGEVYWLTADQPDFSPVLKQSFIGQADGAWHTYRVDMAKSGMLWLDHRVTRLRLDPVAMPADIAIRSIQVNVHCEPAETARCVCPR
ncbi:MAG: hypothetical protein HY868_10705 [Chloroflexi bacterium]|nr:hypothetical protein [Chloroflexota bacterium]